MLSLTWTQTFFSMAAGGGVRGKANGTARGNMIQAGDTIGDVHLFIEAYTPVGGMTIGRIAGEGVNGIRVPHDQVKKNWRTWEKNKHWKKQNNWGVRDSRNDRKRSQQQQQGNHGKGRK
ncbi:hypothetical protein ER57_16495 [Smithella sp. SCADC]|nr:hypothetical protein ER57_16495 [Smithella sp. SCADC]